LKIAIIKGEFPLALQKYPQGYIEYLFFGPVDTYAMLVENFPLFTKKTKKEWGLFS
jgi:hypothetical protein